MSQANTQPMVRYQQIVETDLDDLRIPPRELRKHSPHQITKIAASIRRYGFIGSVIVSESKEIIAGVATVAAARQLGLRNTIHIGHSTGGGEAVRYVARYGQQRAAKLVIIGAVPPIMVKTAANPGGLPIEVLDGLRHSLATNRAQFYIDFPSGPFYGFNRPGAEAVPGIIRNWWRQGMMGSAKAHYEGIKAFSETDFTEDLKLIETPTLVMHSKDDQIVPFANSGPLSAKLLKNGVLKVYEDLPHGMCTTHAEVVNRDLLAFIAA